MEEEPKYTPSIKAISDDEFADLKQLTDILKITNSMPLAVALFIAILFYKKYDGFKHCNCNDYTRKIEDKILYLELRNKDVQLQLDDIRRDINKDKA